MSKSLIYEEKDFIVKTDNDTGDERIAYVFETKDGEVTANFFFTPGDVQIRASIGKEGTMLIGYPFANPVKNPKPLPDPKRLINNIILRLKRGQY